MKFKYIIYKISFPLSQGRSFNSVSKVNLFPKEIIRNYREKTKNIIHVFSVASVRERTIPIIHVLPEENADIFAKDGSVYRV